MELPHLFSESMVLQRNKPIRLWGKGIGKVCVTLDNVKTFDVCCDGNWSVVLPPHDAGGPYELSFKDDCDEVILRDVMIGDVWIAAGQSNMENVTYMTETGFDDAREFGNNTNIRFFTVPRRTEPDCEEYNWHFESVLSKDTPWQICSEQAALHFSAIGFMFAAFLNRDKNIPVGIISCNYGDSRIEAWIERERILEHGQLSDIYNKTLEELDITEYTDEYRLYRKKLARECIASDAVKSVKERGLYTVARTELINWPDRPPVGPYNQNWYGVLYKNMVSRIAPYSVKGVLWYQGESNVANSELYFDMFSLLTESWRAAWYDNLPFLTVQIAPYGYSQPQAWPLLVCEQIRAACELENVGIVTTSDIGEIDNIHPVHKKDVARRLYLSAENLVYGENVEYCGPIYKNIRILDDGTAEIEFYHAESGLVCEGEVAELYVCGEDGKYKPAQSRIKNSKLYVRNSEIKCIKGVKMGFDNFPQINLFNKDGFIAAPFKVEV